MDNFPVILSFPLIGYDDVSGFFTIFVYIKRRTTINYGAQFAKFFFTELTGKDPSSEAIFRRKDNSCFEKSISQSVFLTPESGKAYQVRNYPLPNVDVICDL